MTVKDTKIVDVILAEEAERAGLKPEDLICSNRNRRRTLARDTAIKRIRAETPLSLPAIGRLFGLSHSSVWVALRNEHRDRVVDPDEVITRMWKTNTTFEIATEVGYTSETVRKAGHRLGLGPDRKSTRLNSSHT